MPSQSPKSSRTTKAKPQSSLARLAQFSLRHRMWIFIVFFALVGTYFVVRSLAAAPSIAVVQAEKMSVPAGASIISDTFAAGGQALKLTRNNLGATGQVVLPGNAVLVNVIARGTKCSGGWPQFSLQIDGRTVLPLTTVSSSGWRVYPANVSLTAATHTLTLVPSIAKTCGRTLYVDAVTFYGPAPVTPTPTPAPTPTPTPTPSPYTFSDEFDGPSHAVPSAKWKNDVGSWTPNKEQEYYTAAGVNDYLDGAGHLVIQPTVDNGSHQCWYGTCAFDSARITTLGNFSQAYGTWKARIKLNPQTGLWPAFWFLGDNINTVGWPVSGEIDAMENFGYNAWGGALHGSAVGNDVNFGGGYAGYSTSPTDWHEYGVKVTPDSIAFLFDGITYATQTKAAFIAQYGANSWPFDKPFFPILNVAVGGSGTNYVLPTAPLSPMLVDYVRFTTQ